MTDIFIKTGVEITGQRPVLFLAPMEGVTGAVFREQVCSRQGADIVATEFIRLSSPTQKLPPIVRSSIPTQIQFMASQREVLGVTLRRLHELNRLGSCDWIDLNVGCPSRRVNAKGAGAALLQSPHELVSIVKELREIHDGPLSIKTRIGYENSKGYSELLSALADAPLDFITIHARTKQDLYDRPARWEYLTEAVKRLSYPVIGNGDVWTVEDACRMWRETGVRGVMCGRGMLSNPFLLREIRNQFTFGESNRKLPSALELLEFAHALTRAYMLLQTEKHSYIGPVKEFMMWFSRNPLIRGELFSLVKRMTSLSEIDQVLLREIVLAKASSSP